jgi:16S rRNA (guanine966-N2)-methyltransferase
MRIIAGVAKGRTLKTLRGYDIRPTSDKVRESLFQRFGELGGVCFLDGFAGSGAVGIEALSRGASRVVFVDSDRRACRCIEDNLERAGFSDKLGRRIPEKPTPGPDNAAAPENGVHGAGEGRSWAILPMAMTRAVASLERAGEVFDIVFLDPPYRSEAGLVVLKRLMGSPLLVPGSRVFLEHAFSEQIDGAVEAGWRVVDTRRFGDTRITELASSD